ncbi:MAG: Acyl-protein synthetase, LuxE [Idiomarinaceae bacterium HL-53]|nr:MAG: Acyl-protein synthetase, LuxE [Idiomarinaceae bacterium HL-53]CUS49439.1 Phenylacetate-coenzyme A ligase PaaK, adenylate-forming domain family [Idiomarinaceae bacterium HL-53]
MLASLLENAPYSLPQKRKQELLLKALTDLTEHHRTHCAEYALVAPTMPAMQLNSLEEFPFLTVSLFKQRELKSIPDEQVFKVLQSSGTTGQTPSRIYLDAETAKLQSRVLVKIMQEWLGKQRRHMLIWDHPNVIKDRESFSARGAGIQGLSFLGRDHTYALNEDMSLNIDAIRDFYERFASKPVLMFGFTFMVWKHGVQALEQAGIHLDFEDAVLLHSGGWKKLQDEAVSTQIFNQTVHKHLGTIKVHNFYGMVEQVGSVFVTCEEGHLHCPNTADVIVRDPQTWQPLGEGFEGVIQVLSALPHSYPGHSLLTEDRGRLLGEDNCPCGRHGKYFEVLGRLPKVEARGCSDTFEGSAS